MTRLLSIVTRLSAVSALLLGCGSNPNPNAPPVESQINPDATPGAANVPNAATGNDAAGAAGPGQPGGGVTAATGAGAGTGATTGAGTGATTGSGPR
mgnify:CR=1 FL=1